MFGLEIKSESTLQDGAISHNSTNVQVKILLQCPSHHFLFQPAQLFQPLRHSQTNRANCKSPTWRLHQPIKSKNAFQQAPCDSSQWARHTQGRRDGETSESEKSNFTWHLLKKRKVDVKSELRIQNGSWRFIKSRNVKRHQRYKEKKNTGQLLSKHIHSNLNRG